MRIGRNDPCPCGSGKKYKKCCLNNQAETKPAARPSDADRVAPGEIGDYGPPKLSEEFFAAHPITDFSAYNIARVLMLGQQAMPAILQRLKQHITRGEAEARRIEATDTVAGLLQIMKAKPDGLNHALLIERILGREAQAVPLILADLARPQSDSFTELAIQVLYQTKLDVSAELLALVAQPLASAHALALVCMVLGMRGVRAAVKPLWDCFHFFKEKFPQRNYQDGPLIGLSYLFYPTEPPLMSDELRELFRQRLQASSLASPAESS